ncbi:MAG: phosphoribosylglycinamide formyltransferase [Candidatus Azobacteroides sp.]|nr:phosphoribosylglycinamide formyltransferase [Candidatus Azobacteroides sp.]
MEIKKKKVAILASGSGSNAENIVNYFRNHEQIEISLFIANKKDAFVHERAKRLNIPCYYFSNKQFRETQEVKDFLVSQQIDFLVLAGFLLKIPENLLKVFPDRIINIHPALLPKYGGKGMYGEHVHQAVVEAGEKESGITIHYVNENYDEGEIIFQAKCKVLSGDTPEQVAEKVHALEYEHFPKIIEKVVLG